MSGRGPRAWLGILALLALGMTSCAGPAYGYFQASGNGMAAASIGALSAPQMIAAAESGPGTVALSWESATEPTGTITYFVTRDGEPVGGDCPPSTAAKAVASCTDSGLQAGTYTYVVWARWRSWAAASSAAQVTVIYGEGAHLVVKAASVKPTAGASDNLKITAVDGSGQTLTGYVGPHLLTFSGAAASPAGIAPTVVDDTGATIEFGQPTELEFKAGVASVRSKKNGVMVLYAAGTANVTASDESLPGEAEATLTVVPKTRSQFVLQPSDPTPQAGEADPVEVIALDSYGNTVTSFSGNHSLVYAGAGPSPSGEAPTVVNRSGKAIAFGAATSTTFSEGVASPTGSSNGVMRLYAAGGTNLEVAEGTVTSAPVAVTVAPAGPASLALTVATATPVAGAGDNLITTALDTYGNTATGYAGSKSITFGGPEPSPSGTAASVVDASGATVEIGSPTALTFTSGVAVVAASKNGVFKAAKAGSATLSATDGTISTASDLALTVGAGSAARYAWSSPTVSPGTLGSPCLFTCAITGIGNSGTITAKVAVTDSLGNVVSNLGTANSVKVTATGGTVTGSPLTIATSGPAESTASVTYRSPASGTIPFTITAARSSGTAYTGATATVNK